MSKLAWPLIGSGMLMAALGLYFWFTDAYIGIVIMVAGLVETVVGAVMVDLVARRQRNNKEPK